MIDPEKSFFVPSEEIGYLGLQLIQFLDLCQKVLLKESVSIRLTSKLLGKLTSSFKATKCGQLHNQ